MAHRVSLFEAIHKTGDDGSEYLPMPEASIEQVRRREQRRLEAERQPPLFPEP
jgi:hypothetical protein